jgi:alcohol dehydrogenase class IV
MTPFQHTPPGMVIFGAGTAATAGEKTLLKKQERVLVVTDAAVRGAGLLDGLLGSLQQRAVIVDDRVVADGDCGHVAEVAARAKEAGVTAICAIGGGSVIDSAKGIAAVMATGKAIHELEGVARVRTRTLPLVAIPTTSGTGSEATQFAVIKDRSGPSPVKRILVDTNLIPTLAILDPSLLVGLPRAVTCATAVDALTHAIEALGSRMANPIGGALATEAVRILLRDRALARVLQAPDDVAARAECLMAAHLAGQAVNTCMLGACHALAHVVGATANVPHGVANGLFLVDVMRVNSSRASGIYARLGAAIGVVGVSDDASALIAAVDAFVHDTAGIPRRLRDAAPGVTEHDLPALAAAAALDPDLPTNPIRLDEAALLSILQARW